MHGIIRYLSGIFPERQKAIIPAGQTLVVPSPSIYSYDLLRQSDDFAVLAAMLSEILGAQVAPTSLEQFLEPVGSHDLSKVVYRSEGKALLGWTAWDEVLGDNIYCATFGLKVPALGLPMMGQVESLLARDAVIGSLKSIIYMAHNPEAGSVWNFCGMDFMDPVDRLRVIGLYYKE